MKIKDVLTLSDNHDYMIVSKANYDNKDYLCLVDIKNNKNILFGYLDNDEIVVVKKETINKALLLDLTKNLIVTLGSEIKK